MYLVGNLAHAINSVGGCAQNLIRATFLSGSNQDTGCTPSVPHAVIREFYVQSRPVFLSSKPKGDVLVIFRSSAAHTLIPTRVDAIGSRGRVILMDAIRVRRPWQNVADILPAEGMERQALYNRIGTRDDYTMSVSDMAWGLLNLIERLSTLPSDTVAQLAKPAIMRAFQAARELGEMLNDTKIGAWPLEDDRVTLAEFHVLVVYLKLYCELLDHLDIIDTQQEDLHVTPADFERAMGKMNDWGAPVDNWVREFKRLEAQGRGVVSFDHFSGWALRRAFKSKLNLNLAGVTQPKPEGHFHAEPGLGAIGCGALQAPQRGVAPPESAPGVHVHVHVQSAPGDHCGAKASCSGSLSSPAVGKQPLSPDTPPCSEGSSSSSLSRPTTPTAPAQGELSLTALQLIDMAVHLRSSAVGGHRSMSFRVGKPIGEVKGVASYALSAAGIAELRRVRSVARSADGRPSQYLQPEKQPAVAEGGRGWLPNAANDAKLRGAASRRIRTAPLARSTRRVSVRI